MREATTVADAASILNEAGARFVAVDGSHGSGKTTFADALADALGVGAVHLDDFLERNRGAYLPHLDYRKLAERLSGEPGCVVEGICVLNVLERISMPPDALVYVKRVYRSVWTEESDLEPELPLEEHLAQLQKRLAPLVDGGDPLDGVTEEVIRYHATYKPSERASLVFLRETS